jgi:phage/plasmid primase, P4 family, C-terminal domain
VTALAADPDLTRDDQSDNSDLDEFDDSPELSQDQVEELLESIPGDQKFDDWIRTGYAVYTWDSTKTGKEVFEDWSKTNSKWERKESQKQVDYIWKSGDEDGDNDNNAGIGTLIHKARENGYDGDLGSEPIQPDEDADDWASVRALYSYAQEERSFPKGHARAKAAEMLEQETSWMYVLESERLWVYDDTTGQYDKFGQSHADSRLESQLREYYSKSERSEVIGRLEARNQVHRTALNARGEDDPLLCVSNGVINLRTAEQLPHSPQYRFVRGLDVAYDPENAKPEKITGFLDEITQRTADRDTLLDHLAHGLMPGHPYRAFVVTYGPGGNGKTQAAELFRGFVGRDNAAAVEIDELAEGDFATGDLPGKFINWGDDMAGDGGGQLSDLSLLKKATGGSEIRANEKYEKTFNFKSEAAMFFSANEPPRIGEQKRSIQDRIYPIHMPYEFVSDPDPENPMQKRKTPNVSQALLDDTAAMKGMLQLAVEHAKELIDNRGQYSQPETPQERLEKYNRSADPIQKFGAELLEEAGPSTRIRKDDAYRVYRAFTDSIEERSSSELGFKRQLPGTLSWEADSAQSRALATADDDSNRVHTWKRMQWTENAKAHMADWLIERYADHFDSTEPAADTNNEPVEGQSAGSNPTPIAIASLSTGRGIRFTAEIVNVSEGEYSRVAQGEFEGQAGTRLGWVIPGGNSSVFDGCQGKTVRISKATLRTDQDGLKEVVVNDATEVEIVEPTADTQAGLDTAEEATTDGGEEAEANTGTSDEAATDGAQGAGAQLKKQVKDELRTEYGPRAECSVAGIAGALDADPTAVETVLADLVTRSKILEETEDGYRRLS